nr:MAG: hypothetical protein [Metapenaeopsis lamellata majanivirus]
MCFRPKRARRFSFANIQRFMIKLFKMYDLPKLRITSIRKFITTQVHQGGDDKFIESTASLLKHSMKTAKLDYKAMQLDYDAFSTVSSISKLMTDKVKRTMKMPDDKATDRPCSYKGNNIIKEQIKKIS